MKLERMIKIETNDIQIGDKILYGCGWDNSEIARFRPISLISLRKDKEEEKA